MALPVDDIYLAPSGTTTVRGGILVGDPPQITTHPSSLTRNEGQTATFTVAAIGSAPITYQWRKNGVAISGATSASYTTPSLTLSDNGAAFDCVATNAFGSATSNAANLTVQSGVQNATAFTLSGPTTGTTGVASTYTVTPNGVIGTACVVNITAPGASLSVSSLSFGSGTSGAQTFTVTRASDGTTAISISNTGGLANNGSPINLTTAPAAAFASLSLLSATTQTAPFCVGQSFKQGDVPAGQSVSVIGATAQYTPKTTWPDGSAKFGVIAGTVSLAANTPTVVTMQPGSGSSGVALTTADLQAAMTQPVVVDAGAFGSATWSGSDWLSPFSSWVSGHLMSSWLYRKQIGSDAHLVAWLEVRLWSTGAVEVLPWVENGYLLVGGPTSKSATYSFTMGGTQRFSASIDFPHHTRSPLVSGTALSHWLGNDPLVTPKHDVDYMQSTGLVPAYFAKTPDGASSIATLPGTYTPLQRGNFPAGIGGGGANNYVGLLPEWDALYLTNGNAATYAGVVRNGYSAGRYPFHYRDESNGFRPPRLSQHPTLNIREPAAGWNTTPATSGTPPAGWSLSHQPSVGYLAYLVTGRKYFLDELQFVASTNPLFNSSTVRENGAGLFKSNYSGNERLVAWCWRTLAHAIAVTPDDDTVFLGEYKAHLANLVNYYHARYIQQSHNPHGWISPTSDYNSAMLVYGTVSAGATTTVIQCNAGGLDQDYTADGQYVGWTCTINGEERPVVGYVKSTNTLTVSPGFSSPPTAGQIAFMNDGKYFVSSWQQDYVTAVWGWCKDLGLNLGATTDGRLNALFAWKANSIVGRLGTDAADQFLWRDYTPYTVAVSPSDTPDWDGGTGPWYSNWGQVYSATFSGQTLNGLKPPPYASLGPKVLDGDIRLDLQAGYPASESLPAIAYAVKHGIPGAEAGYQRLTNATNWHTFQNNLDINPGWGIAPYAYPKWWRGIAVNEVREIPASSMSLNAPNVVVARGLGGETAVGSGNSYGARLNAYCGMTVDTRRSTLWTVAAGGHGDYFNNELVYQNLMEDSPKWAIYFNGSSGNVVNMNPTPGAPENARYADGLPCSRHTYYQTQFIERHNRAITCGGSISFPGTGYQDIEAFNVDAGVGVNGWDPLYTYPGLYGGQGPGGIEPSCTKDPSTERIYAFSGGKVWMVAPRNDGVVGGTPSIFMNNSGLNPGNEGATAVDFTRNRLLWTHGWGSSQPQLLNLANATISPSTYTGAAAAALSAEPTGGVGVCFVPHIDAYLVRFKAAGQSVYRINANSLAVTTVTMTGATIPAGEGSGYEGIFNKWQFVPKLRGVVYCPGAGKNTFFIRTH